MYFRTSKKHLHNILAHIKLFKTSLKEVQRLVMCVDSTHAVCYNIFFLPFQRRSNVQTTSF